MHARHTRESVLAARQRKHGGQRTEGGAGVAEKKLFAMTLGTYSIIPTIYLWREVSKRLAVFLFAFFVVTGATVGLAF